MMPKRNASTRSTPVNLAKHIDIMPPKEKNPVLGIYRIKGDELRLFLRHANGPGGRPTAFSTTAGSNLILMVFTRTKPE